MAQEELNEEPLDPSVERVRRKMMRLMAISISIMMIGLIAVIGAIFYKINSKSENNPGSAAKQKSAARINTAQSPNNILEQGAIDIPDSAEIIDAYLNNRQILLTLQLSDGSKALWIYDLSAGNIVSRISIR